jgi:hypothetical protein
MDKLEKFIEENLEAFDDAEPMAGHFSRFEEKLNKQIPIREKRFERSMILKIAAGLLILMTISVFIFDMAKRHSFRNGTGSENAAVLTPEMKDAIQYYDDAASQKLGMINQLACCGQDTRKVYTMANDEMKSLNASADELKKALAENPGNERIQAAIIQNHQMKEKVMNQVVNKMKRR